MFNKAVLIVENSFWSIWWMCLTLLFALCIFENRLNVLSSELDQLHQQWTTLLSDKEKAANKREVLKLQINSQSDPAWVELTLKKGLGLVPEGQTKVFFSHE